MDPFLLLNLGLIFLVVANAFIAFTYTISYWCATQDRSSGRWLAAAINDHRQAFAGAFIHLCILEMVFLIAAFCHITSELDKMYQAIEDTAIKKNLADIWGGLCVVFVIISIVEFSALYWNEHLHWLDMTGQRAMSSSPIVDVDGAFIISHSFLTFCASLCVLISTCDGWLEEARPSNFMETLLIMAGFAIVAFELGAGFFIYAFPIAWRRRRREERGTRPEARQGWHEGRGEDEEMRALRALELAVQQMA